MVAEPFAPLLTALPIAGTTPGSFRRYSSIAAGCWRAKSSAVMVMIGLLDVRPGVRMRVPVTTISSATGGRLVLRRCR